MVAADKFFFERVVVFAARKVVAGYDGHLRDKVVDRAALDVLRKAPAEVNCMADIKRLFCGVAKHVDARLAGIA